MSASLDIRRYSIGEAAEMISAVSHGCSDWTFPLFGAPEQIFPSRLSLIGQSGSKQGLF